MSIKRVSIPKDKLLVLAIFTLTVGATVGLQLLRGGNGKPKPGSLTSLQPSKVGEFRGFSLQLHNGRADHPFETYIKEIALTGANTVHLVIPAFQENCSSTSIFIDLRKAPSNERLKKLIAEAHKLHLRVVLMPIVLLENRRKDEWRGKIAPTSWPDWWEDYTQIILHYAKIAQATKCEMFIVGSELVSTESDTNRWRELIRRVRKAYQGRLSYSANWDHYRPVKFWDDLDIIGMTTYYDLTKGKSPTLARLLKAWKPIKKDILEWRAKTHPDKPIIFTEVGWPNQDTAAQYPWNYYQSDTTDPQTQANCFRAFFQTWIKEKAVAGFLVWEWQSYPGQDTSAKNDKSYVPKNKPAMKVISEYFRHPSPWGKATSAPAAATRPC